MGSKWSISRLDIDKRRKKLRKKSIGFRDDTEDLSLDALMDELDILMRKMYEDYQKNGLLKLK